MFLNDHRNRLQQSAVPVLFMDAPPPPAPRPIPKLQMIQSPHKLAERMVIKLNYNNFGSPEKYICFVHLHRDSIIIMNRISRE